MNEVDRTLQIMRRLRIVFWSVIAVFFSQLVVLCIAAFLVFCLYTHNRMLDRETMQDQRLDAIARMSSNDRAAIHRHDGQDRKVAA